MEADKTDKIIAAAIAALPYRRPSAAFTSRVMAAVMAEAGQPWYAGALKAAGLVVSAWVSALVLVSGRLVYAHIWDIADLLMKPGGAAQAFKLLAAHAALALAKTKAAVSILYGLASAAGAGLPAWYEVAAAAALCSAAIAVLSKGGKLARQGI